MTEFCRRFVARNRRYFLKRRRVFSKSRRLNLKKWRLNKMKRHLGKIKRRFSQINRQFNLPIRHFIPAIRRFGFHQISDLICPIRLSNFSNFAFALVLFKSSNSECWLCNNKLFLHHSDWGFGLNDLKLKIIYPSVLVCITAV